MAPVKPPFHSRAFLAAVLLAFAASRGEAPAAEEETATVRLDPEGRFSLAFPAESGNHYYLFRGTSPDRCDFPVQIRAGAAGPLTMRDSIPSIGRAFFEVLAVPDSAPRDTDGDGIPDPAELLALPEGNPFNPAPPVPAVDGAIYLADRAAFDAVSHRDNFPGAPGVREVKFLITGADTAAPKLYFLNLHKHLYHYYFATDVLGHTESLTVFNNETYFTNLARKQIAGSLVAHDAWRPPGGGPPGVITMEFWPSDPVSFPFVKKAYDLVTRSTPGLGTRIAYHAASETQRTIQRTEREEYTRAALGGMHTITSEELLGQTSYTLLNPGIGFGRLIVFDGSAPLSARDIPIFRTLPNDITRTAGIITEAAQTPLSHINLKAKQNNTPNVFLKNAATDPRIVPLLGKYVRFEALADDITLREATQAEVDEHLEALRPTETQFPLSDLTQQTIMPLGQLGFASAAGFGAKAANVAEMRKFLPNDMIPNGLAIPFHFYREYMKTTGLDTAAAAMLAEPAFRNDPEIRAARLDAFRKSIRSASAPAWIVEAVGALQTEFPENQPIRCRSSTNNEDLENFSGAGLYDSYTHRPDEGHLLKTVKKVWASLWNDRAFDEREFYRVDHLSTNMGVLVIPNFDDELANGVGVTKNLIDPNWTGYYINAQAGESLVTNPDSNAVPEEFLIADLMGLTRYEIQYVTFSNLMPEGQTVLSRDQAEQLADRMRDVQNHFLPLYHGNYYTFAMEIEWKIDSAGKLIIKQARPWID